MYRVCVEALTTTKTNPNSKVTVSSCVGKSSCTLENTEKRSSYGLEGILWRDDMYVQPSALKCTVPIVILGYNSRGHEVRETAIFCTIVSTPNSPFSFYTGRYTKTFVCILATGNFVCTKHSPFLNLISEWGKNASPQHTFLAERWCPTIVALAGHHLAKLIHCRCFEHQFCLALGIAQAWLQFPATVPGTLYLVHSLAKKVSARARGEVSTRLHLYGFELWLLWAPKSVAPKETSIHAFYPLVSAIPVPYQTDFFRSLLVKLGEVPYTSTPLILCVDVQQAIVVGTFQGDFLAFIMAPVWRTG